MHWLISPSPVSINLMANAAEQAKFTYDVTNATSAYLMFIRNLGTKECRNCNPPGKNHYRPKPAWLARCKHKPQL